VGGVGAGSSSASARGRGRVVAAALAAVAVLVVAGCGLNGSAKSSGSPSVTEIALPDKVDGGSTHELVLGPDGNVWVTQQKQARLVRTTRACRSSPRAATACTSQS
jgi:virginiamycin B lyase